MDASLETANEFWIIDELLCNYGLDIDADDRMVRCLALSGFFVATHSAEPDLTIYRISQLDNEQKISHLFSAARHRRLGSTAYVSIATDLGKGPSEHLR